MDERPFAHRGWGRARLHSFRDAWAGLVFVLRSQRNAQIHFACALLAIGAGFYFGLDRLEWALVLGAIALVGTAEAVNTAIETVVDLVSPERHPLAGRGKDIAAGAVLLAAIGAAAIGACIFWPKVSAWLGGGGSP